MKIPRNTPFILLANSSANLRFRDRWMNWKSHCASSIIVRMSSSFSTGSIVESPVSPNVAKVPPRKKRKEKTVPSNPNNKSNNDPTRPGKKALRKLRFQQKQQSPFEYMLTTAQKSIFTQSVFLSDNLIQPPPPLNDGVPESCNADEKDDIADTASKKRVIQVITQAPVHPQPPSPTFGTHHDAPFGTATIQVQPLLILDMNGILCHRYRNNKTLLDISHFRPSLDTIALTPIIPRTDLTEFLHYLDAHFCLAIWTSAKRKNAHRLVQALIPTPIAERLLFLWDQSDCIPLAAATTDQWNVPTFVKDLSKVWKRYPLWNTSNTLLIDDSPEKCLYWRENAVHPPAINGLRSMDDVDMDNVDHSLLLSDESNQQMQLHFFQRLAQHWQENPIVHTWEEEGEDVIIDSNSMAQMNFLQQHAVGHMGWDPPLHHPRSLSSLTSVN
jgi:hypothetical protein